MKQEGKLKHSHQIKQMIECILKALIELPFSLVVHTEIIKSFLFPWIACSGMRVPRNTKKRNKRRIEKKIYEMISRAIEFFYEKLFLFIWISSQSIFKSGFLFLFLGLSSGFSDIHRLRFQTIERFSSHPKISFNVEFPKKKRRKTFSKSQAD